MTTGLNATTTQARFTSLANMLAADLQPERIAWVHGVGRYDIYATDQGGGVELANGNWAQLADGGTDWGGIGGTLSHQTDLQAALDAKVSAVVGKQLSTEDYTTVEKTKVADSIDSAEKGAAGGVATLDVAGLVPASQLPSSGGGVDGSQLTCEHSVALPTTSLSSPTIIPFGSTYFTVTNGIAGGSIDVSGNITLPAGTYNITGWTSSKNLTSSQYGARVDIVSTAGDTINKCIGGSRVDNVSGTERGLSTPFSTIITLTQETILSIKYAVANGQFLPRAPDTFECYFGLEITKL